MTLPLAFLLGLLVVFGARELGPSLPGSASLAGLLPFLALLALPSLLAGWSSRRIRRELIEGRRSRVPPRALLRLSALATPLVVYLLHANGAYGDFVDRWSGNQHLASTLLLLLPLLVAELPRLAWSTATALHCEIDDEVAGSRSVAATMLPGRRDLWPVVRMAMGWPVLLVMPLVLFGLLLDIVQLDREAYVFLLGTTMGSTLSTLLFLLLAAVLLPFWFRISFGVVPLPEPIGMHLRHCATRLGFDGRRVMMLPTGMRAMNAMMVGPLPVGRCLCITDGLLRALDADALAGVVGHEIGHAKRGHPGLLMTLVVLVPLLLMSPARLLDLQELDVTTKSLLAGGTLVLLWSLVRALAHRFEHEADAVSVQALGASPCTRALLVVSRLAVHASHGFLRRVFSLHPEEQRRWELMRRYESEPAFRQDFEAKGRCLRGVVFGLLALAFVGAACTWVVEWPFERAIWRFHSGDFVAARRLVAEVGTVPQRWEVTWKELGEELAAAAEIAPQAADWESATSALQERAWRRGVEVLLGAGPAAARPWFSLAVEVEKQASDLQRAVHEFCEAAAEHDTGRMDELKGAVRRIGVPAELLPVFRE